LPNPSANHGLFNAVNSAGTQVASRSVYVGTLGIEMDWLSTHMRTEIDAKAMDQHKCVPVWLKDDEYVHCYHHYCKQI
ncbi:glycosyltransferase family 20 protein, partial [Klebsiella pneumoniae]|nr:glycosyltransferase family 20 protein [Klebsiella pneumoniae]